MGVAKAFWQLGAPVGLFLGAYLFEQFGTSSGSACQLIAVLYTAFLLPEVPQPKPTKSMVFGKYGNYGTYTEAPKRVRYYSEHETLDSPHNIVDSQQNPPLNNNGPSRAGNAPMPVISEADSKTLLGVHEHDHSAVSQYLTPQPLQNYIQEDSSDDDDHVPETGTVTEFVVDPSKLLFDHDRTTQGNAYCP